MGQGMSMLFGGRQDPSSKGRRRLAFVVLAILLSAIAAGDPASAGAAAPPIRHVWVINLENSQVCINGAYSPVAVQEGFAGCPVPGFQGSAPYLGNVLPAQGTLVENYYGIGHESLDNYIA